LDREILRLFKEYGNTADIAKFRAILSYYCSQVTLQESYPGGGAFESRAIVFNLTTRDVNEIIQRLLQKNSKHSITEAVKWLRLIIEYPLVDSPRDPDSLPLSSKDSVSSKLPSRRIRPSHEMLNYLVPAAAKLVVWDDLFFVLSQHHRLYSVAPADERGLSRSTLNYFTPKLSQLNPKIYL
jgi:hypothetical protein